MCCASPRRRSRSRARRASRRRVGSSHKSQRRAPIATGAAGARRRSIVLPRCRPTTLRSARACRAISGLPIASGRGWWGAPIKRGARASRYLRLSRSRLRRTRPGVVCSSWPRRRSTSCLEIRPLLGRGYTASCSSRAWLATPAAAPAEIDRIAPDRSSRTQETRPQPRCGSPGSPRPGDPHLFRPPRVTIRCPARLLGQPISRSFYMLGFGKVVEDSCLNGAIFHRAPRDRP